MVGVCPAVVEDSGRTMDQWDFVLTNFGIDPAEVWVRLFNGSYSGQFTQRVDTAADLPAGVPIVVLQPEGGRYVQGVTPLDQFVHPASCIYVFGPDDRHMDPIDDLGGRTPEHLVCIPCSTHHEMYSWVAAAVTLWDRKVKGG